jgi:hypothetical protein
MKQLFVCFDYPDLIIKLKRLKEQVVLVSNNDNRLFLSVATIKTNTDDGLKNYIENNVVDDYTGFPIQKDKNVFPIIVKTIK